jgi:hypothetical protein
VKFVHTGTDDALAHRNTTGDHRTVVAIGRDFYRVQTHTAIRGDDPHCSLIVLLKYRRQRNDELLVHGTAVEPYLCRHAQFSPCNRAAQRHPCSVGTTGRIGRRGQLAQAPLVVFPLAGIRPQRHVGWRADFKSGKFRFRYRDRHFALAILGQTQHWLTGTDHLANLRQGCGDHAGMVGTQLGVRSLVAGQSGLGGGSFKSSFLCIQG